MNDTQTSGHRTEPDPDETAYYQTLARLRRAHAKRDASPISLEHLHGKWVARAKQTWSPAFIFDQGEARLNQRVDW